MPPLEMSLSPGRMVVEHCSWEKIQQEPGKRSPGSVKKEMGSFIKKRLRYTMIKAGRITFCPEL